MSVRYLCGSQFCDVLILWEKFRVFKYLLSICSFIKYLFMSLLWTSIRLRPARQAGYPCLCPVSFSQRPAASRCTPAAASAPPSPRTAGGAKGCIPLLKKSATSVSLGGWKISPKHTEQFHFGFAPGLYWQQILCSSLWMTNTWKMPVLPWLRQAEVDRWQPEKRTWFARHTSLQRDSDREQLSLCLAPSLLLFLAKH